MLGYTWCRATGAGLTLVHGTGLTMEGDCAWCVAGKYQTGSGVDAAFWVLLLLKTLQAVPSGLFGLTRGLKRITRAWGRSDQGGRLRTVRAWQVSDWGGLDCREQLHMVCRWQVPVWLRSEC